MGAGCMFGNDTHILLAVHGREYNRRGVPVKLLNGFGGRREGEETPQETALREVLEEMFGIEKPNEIPEWPRMLEDFQLQKPKQVIHMETQLVLSKRDKTAASRHFVPATLKSDVRKSEHSDASFAKGLAGSPDTFQERIPSLEKVCTPHYVTFEYTIDDLCQFLQVWEHVFTSSYYKVFPRTLEELLFTRVAPETAEVSHILLWPRSLLANTYFLSNDVIHDLSVKS